MYFLYLKDKIPENSLQHGKILHNKHCNTTVKSHFHKLLTQTQSVGV